MAGPASDRLDRWLWQARFFRTRTLSARAVAAGRVRVNAARVDKPATRVGPGDVLTLQLPSGVRVVRILALAARRGPAAEAAALYVELAEPVPARPAHARPLQRQAGAPKPRAEGRGAAEPSGVEP